MRADLEVADIFRRHGAAYRTVRDLTEPSRFTVAV
jgi:hypothetical protein